MNKEKRKLRCIGGILKKNVKNLFMIGIQNHPYHPHWILIEAISHLKEIKNQTH